MFLPLKQFKFQFFHNYIYQYGKNEYFLKHSLEISFYRIDGINCEKTELRIFQCEKRDF